MKASASRCDASAPQRGLLRTHYDDRCRFRAEDGIRMVNRSVGYAYPWDYVGDPAAATRAAELGLDSAALAASYHATRAGTPLHPGHRVFEVESACYVPVRPDAWRGHRLVPAVPAWDPAGTS